MSRYARLRDDFTRPKWCNASRTAPDNPCRVKAFSGKYLPESVRYSHGPSQFSLSADYQAKIASLNAANQPYAVKYLNRLGSGIRNNGGSWQWEALSFAGNIVEVTNVSMDGTKAYVKGVDMTKAPPAGDFTSSPEIYHVFTVITPDNRTVLPSIADGSVDAQLFLVGVMQDYRQRYFMVEDIEFLPALPCNVVVTVSGLNVRSTPAGPVVRVAPQGEQFTVTEYAPRAEAVWGKVADGWIALQHPYVDGYFPTTWAIQTIAPPVA